jgi:hypothetical protein
MVKISNIEDLKATFRKIDQDKVAVPAEMKFPLGLRQTLRWIEPSGARIFFVFEDPVSHLPMGLVFHRNPGTPSPINMCDWCHSVRGGNEVNLLTVNATAHRRIGANLCQNLDCVDKLAKPPGVNDLPESFDQSEKLARLMHRISTFARKNFF